MKDKVYSLVIKTIAELNEDWNNEGLNKLNINTRLFAPRGNLDSIGLVTLLASLEEALYDEFDIEVNLADERAMSQKTSPFRSVRFLVNYIDQLVTEVS